MSISTGLDWTGNLADNADKTASSVDRLVQSLRALQSLQGKSGPTSAGLGGAAAGIGGIGAAAKEQNKAVLIQAKSAADLAKIEAQRLANLDAIAAKQNAAVTNEGAKGAARVAAIQAQSDADRNRAIGRVVESQVKAADAIAIEQAKGAQSAQRAIEKAALVEQQGAHKASAIREKGAANIAIVEAKKSAELAKLEAKRRVDIEKDARKAATKAASAPRRVTEETTSGLGGAAKAILEGKGLKGALGAFGGKGAKIAAIGEVALSIGRAAFDAAKQVAGIGFEFGKATVASQAYKEDIQEAFKTVRKTTTAADATMRTALQNADRLGIARADSVGQFLDLATKGFDDSKIKEIQGRLLDITTIDPRASIEGLTKVIGKVQATGRLNQETLNELSTFGLEQSDVIKEIGKVLKKSDAQVLKALSTTGGIRGLGVDPILNAIAAQTGGGIAGDKAAAKANRNLSSLIKRVTEIPSNILFDVEVGTGLDGIKGVLRSILDFFASGSETAKNASKVIGGAFNALISGLTGKDITKDAGGITDFIADLISLIEIATPGIKAFGSAIRVVATAAAFVVAGIGNLLAFLSGDTTNLTAFGDNAETIGTSIVDGITRGIMARGSTAIEAAKSVANSVLQGAKSVLRIASPSKEAAELGGFFSEGMGQGIERNADYATRAARMMAEDALVAASMQAPRIGPAQAAQGGAGERSSGIRSRDITINVNIANAGNDSELDKESLKDKYRPAFRELFIELFAQIAQEG